MFEIVSSTNIREKDNFRQYIRSLGVRQYDAYKAVGNTNEWYQGYQSFDFVHPSSQGATAL